MFFRITLLLLAITTPLRALILEDLIESNRLSELLQEKKLGYYTGSFDPIHVGHKDFIQGVIDAGFCDYILIVPA